MTKFKHILLFICLTSSLIAQDIKQEIININKKYFEQNESAVEVISQAFVGDSKDPVNESKMTVYKKPGKYLYINGPSESMANNNYRLNVDHNKRIIIVTKLINKAPTGKKSDAEIFDSKEFNLKLDTVMTLYKRVSINSKNETTNEIVFQLKESNYSIIKISYDKKTYVVKDYFIKTNPIAVKGQNIEYSYFIKNNFLSNKVANSMFNELNYITIKNKQILPNSKYASYKIVNNNQKG